MAAVESKLQQYFNLECIEKYLVLIQKLVLSAPDTLSPMTVLCELLYNYQQVAFLNSSITNFFKSFCRSHTRFAQMLLDNLEHKDFNVAQQMDQYLKDRKLDKKGDFFSLTIAWLYYYKDTLINLSNYQHLKKQIIIPLHIFRKEKLKSEIDFCVEELQSDDPKNVQVACITLGKLPISESSKKPEVINKLLEMVNKTAVVQGSGGVMQYYDHNKAALESLSNIPISLEMSEAIVDVLLMSGSYNCEELYLLLKNIPIPNARIPLVMDFLYEQINRGHSEIQRAAWEVIQYHANGIEGTVKWIDSILKEINVILAQYCLGDKSRALSSLLHKLETASIPDERKQKIIEFAFNLINRFNHQQIARDACLLIINDACLLIRNCAPLSDDAFNDRVVAELLSILEKAPNIIYGYDALSRFQIPEHDMKRVVKLLVAGLEKDDVVYSKVLKCIRNIRFPIEFKKDLIKQLISVIKDDKRMLQMESYSVLAELGIPKDELENIVSLMLKRFSDETRNGWEQSYILDALPKINIPAILMEPLQKTLLASVLRQITEINYLPTPCIALGKIRLYPESALPIIRELITALILEKVHCEQMDDVLRGIYELSKSLDTSTIISVQIMLDHILSTTKDPVIAMWLFSFHHQLGQLRGQKEFLQSAEPTLPPEIVFHISRFL